jgi:integrase
LFDMADRRDKGTGSVYHDKKRDRWRGEVTVDGRRYRVTGKTSTEARRKLRMLTAKRDTGQRVGPSAKTVADAAAEFRRTLPNRKVAGRPLAPATLARYDECLRIIVDELGAEKIGKLRTSQIETMLDELATRDRRPLSLASLDKVRGVLRRVIDHQVKRREIDHNPATAAELPPDARREDRRQSLDPEAARRLLAGLRGESNGAMYALMLRLGLRPGEAGALYWSDLIKPAAGPSLLNITRGLRAEGHRIVVSDELKTAASRRTIELPADLEQWLTDHRADQVRRRLAAREWVDENLMFASTHGRPLVRKAAREKLARICREHEVYVIARADDDKPRPPRPNELRHSCASLLSDEGVPNEQIADLLGHTTTRMVDQTYRHRLRPVVDVAARATWAAGESP